MYVFTGNIIKLRNNNKNVNLHSIPDDSKAGDGGFVQYLNDYTLGEEEEKKISSFAPRIFGSHLRALKPPTKRII